jgi:5-methyltetrahydropteroyltriglutamate--homocysteine methyltransferase
MPPGKTVMLGALNLGSPEIEMPETVAARIRAGLAVPPTGWIVPAPDYNTKHRPRERLFGRLHALAEGAEIIRRELAS